uniref:Probable G-protein coupled receptor 83 n=1 Tax=Ictidomys tridecemlineatus TaxID=43179 RepID=I3MS85_ICTTR|nr:probable G-protein coupled receptor 83 isoform X1 [Ictidomys tridecemlineatus]XP_040138101.1 probable G-protein coupled receptor 83 isoform X1 [Ictidomys tridecemlineatus]XP_040138106.1 probable G-protein coupled receptor 83 isoform X1 [Ictidomys tridecemlineatus]
MNYSFNGNGTSPFQLQMERAIDWLHQNFTEVPPIEDQSCNHTDLNGSSVSSPELEGPTGMGWKWLGGKPHIAAKIILSVAYAVIIMVSLFGNSLVCQVFIKHKEINKSTGLLIFNLAISDILIILLNSPFALARFLSGQWVFGRIMCHVSRFAQYCSLHVSTLTLMAVAMDRHRVILHPTKPRLTHSQSILTVVLIWSLAVFLALPHAIYQNLFYVISKDGVVRSHCLPAFPGPSKLVGKYVDLGTFGLLYILPLLVIVITYSHLGKRLWIQNSVGDASARQLMAHYQKRKKSIRMLILIVMVFAICWFPLNCYVVLISSADVETESVLFYAFHWFAMSSTCYNPFIYCWLNRSFRAKLRSIASWCTKYLLCKSSQVQQQAQVQESHELQELQASALPQVPVAIPEPQVLEDPCVATGEGDAQISAQMEKENPNASVSRRQRFSILRPFFCIRVHSVKI